MKIENAVEFLENQCPFSDKDDVTQETIDKYRESIDLAEKTQDERLVLPLMTSFGPGSGYGLYQMVIFAFQKYDKIKLVKPLIQSLQNPDPNIRYWACQHALDLSIAETAPYLRNHVNDEDDSIAFFASAALEFVGDRSDYEMIKDRAQRVDDSETKAMFDELLSEIEKKA